jgi:1,2-diacylglycerol 3-beta-galactosyltransferase
VEAIEWKIPVKVRGFETIMAKWMGACDCIITKVSCTDFLQAATS